MTKHTDTSRSADSGVSDNAQTGAREIRWMLDASLTDEFWTGLRFGLFIGAVLCLVSQHIF